MAAKNITKFFISFIIKRKPSDIFVSLVVLHFFLFPFLLYFSQIKNF